jgi:hypothetical protein
MCRSSFQQPPYRHDFRLTDWAKFQAHLEDEMPFNLELHNRMTIGTSVENFSGRRSEGTASFHSQESSS